MLRYSLVGRALGLLFVVSAVSACLALGDADLATLEPGAAPLQPTYTEHIEPFLEHYCVSCHSPEASGARRTQPYFNTRSTSDEEDWCDAFAQVEARQMPPGAMERPSAVERLTFRRWVASVFAGNPNDCDELFGDVDDD